MNTSVDRNRLPELGKQIYDTLSPISPHEDWLYLTFMYIKGEEKKKILMKFLDTGNRDWGDIHRFIRKNFDYDMNFVEI